MSLGIVLLIAAAVCAVIAVFVLAAALSLLHKAQNAAFYGLRQDARKAAGQRLVIMTLLSALAGSALVAQWMLPPDALSTPLLPFGGAAVINPTPEAVAADPDPTATPAPAPTSAPAAATPTPVSAKPTPGANSDPALPDANKRLTFHAIANAITSNGGPRDSASRFSARTNTIYVFYNYHDVPPRATVRHTWFHNGGSVYFENVEFDGKLGEGVGAVAWTPSGGFEPGLYEVRIVLGNVPQFVANFEIR
jgi:hypothetical protein